MQCQNRHPTDDELLLLDDPQALGGRRRRALRQHVAECARCAARRSRLAADLAEVASLWRGSAAHEAGADRLPDDGRLEAAERAHRVARGRFERALDARAVRGASGGAGTDGGAGRASRCRGGAGRADAGHGRATPG